jgi:hypothetical protein
MYKDLDFESTRRSWQSIFGTPPAASFMLMYSHTIGHRLARFPCRFRSIASPRLPSTAQTVVVLYNRSSLIPWKTLSALHTHPGSASATVPLPLSCQHPAETPYTATSARWHSPLIVNSPTYTLLIIRHLLGSSLHKNIPIRPRGRSVLGYCNK